MVYRCTLITSVFWFFTICGVYKAQAQGEYSITRSGNRYIQHTGDLYRDRIQPILAKRCVTCHSCNSAPCQLNMSSFAGLVRGMSKDNPHASGRGRIFGEVERARLEDYFSEDEWRRKGFYPVLPQAGSKLEDSLLFLALNNQETERYKPSQKEVKLRRSLLLKEKFECPVNAKEYEHFADRYPFAQMPLDCANLPQEERHDLLEWILTGAPGPSGDGLKILVEPTATEASGVSLEGIKKQIQEFESYLNAVPYKRQAVARYLYEHMYAMNLIFPDNPGEFYRIVRSRTPSLQPIELVVTEFATDDPKGEFFYRLQKVDRVIELKRHVPFYIGAAFIQGIDEMFFAKDLEGSWGPAQTLASYPDNPFEWMHILPAMGRARFVEKYAKDMMQVVARGAICHGANPSYVSPDYAWFLILKPESDPSVQIPALGQRDKQGFLDFSLFYTHPRELSKKLSFPMYYPWKAGDYNRAFLTALDSMHPDGIGLEDISKVDLFYSLRHQTSLEFYSVKEMSAPGYTDYKMLWSYADFENFYYRTSVHYKYYGSVAHKFETFYAVIQRRSLGEYMFSLLNPNYEKRKALLRWFTSLRGRQFYRLNHNLLNLDSPSRRAKEKDQSFTLLSRRILDLFANYQNQPEMVHFHPSLRTDLKAEVVDSIANEHDFEKALRTLTGKRGTFAVHLPQLVHLRFAGKTLYTLYPHRGNRNDKIISLESSAMEHQYDQLNAAKGLVGAFPYMFLDVSCERANDFISKLKSVRSKEHWDALVSDFGIARNSADFYPMLDWMHAWISQNLKDKGGLLDIRNYEVYGN